MEIQAMIQRMKAQRELSNMISPDTEVKCKLCNDIGLVPVEGEDNLFKRCVCVEREYIQKLWERSGVNPSKVSKLNEYIPYDELTQSAKDKAIKYILNFETIKTQRENSFGVFGQNGAGKSHIVIAIGAALLNKDISVVYMPYIETMQELKSNTNDIDYNQLVKKYTSPKVLIIDDLFRDKVKDERLIGELKEADIKHIFPILNTRYLNHMPILVSTQCTPKMLITLDESIARRILEPCGDNITIFNNKKYNYSLRKYEK